MDWTCLSSTSHRCLNGLTSGEHLKPFLNQFSFVAWRIILLKEATVIKKFHFHERVYMVCNNA